MKEGEDRRGRCAFCGLGRETSDRDLVKSGGFFRLGELYLHYFCVLFNKRGDLRQLGRDEEGLFGFFLPDIRRVLQLGRADDCRFCDHPNATVRCALDACRMEFHFSCGAANGCAFVFQGRYDAFCPRHRPRQARKVVEACTEDRTCVAGCMDEVREEHR